MSEASYTEAAGVFIEGLAKRRVARKEEEKTKQPLDQVYVDELRRLGRPTPKEIALSNEASRWASEKRSSTIDNQGTGKSTEDLSREQTTERRGGERKIE